MGYRSDVTIIMYAERKDFAVFKLWFDENMVPVLKEHWASERVKEFERKASEAREYKGYAIHIGNVKWYDDDPDVIALNEAWDKFAELFDENNTLEIGAEFMRIGEDYGDVEYNDTRHAQGLLELNRKAEY